jgi:hypothetical protein
MQLSCDGMRRRGLPHFHWSRLGVTLWIRPSERAASPDAHTVFIRGAPSSYDN